MTDPCTKIAVATMSGLVLALAAVSPAKAQQAEVPQGGERPSEFAALDEPEPETDSRLSVDAGMTFVSRYISRGIAFSDQPSIQPFVSASLSLPELTGGPVSDASIFVGTWNSIQFTEPGLGQPSSGALAGWYETDLYAGAAVEIKERWTISATYYRYESPGNSFAGYNDLELIVRLDDASLWEGVVPLESFTLSPRLRIVQEAGRPRRPDALYVQPSLTPSFDIGGPQRPVRIAIPLVLGFSDNYYDSIDGGKESFGFFRTGATVSLAPLPDAAPALRVNGGFDLWLLNDQVANGLDDQELVGRLGLNWSF